MKRRVLPLSVLWVLALVAYGMVLVLRAGADTEAGDPMLQLAVYRYKDAQDVLWETRRKHLDEETLREVERNDAIRSGLIGAEWTGLTTTAGTLDAKRATVSPAWISLFRRWYQQLGLRTGDRVAINSSASFPALFYAARLAAESLGLETHSVISLTASNFGANLPDFDYWEMETALQERQILPRSVFGVTPGGHGDVAAGLDAHARAALRVRIDELEGIRGGPEVLWPANTEESRDFRRRILLGKFRPDVYVSIGGHATGYGTGLRALALPRGVIRPEQVGEDAVPESVLGDALRLDIPVINVLDIRGIMAEEGLPPGGEMLLEPLPPTRRTMALFGAFFIVAAIVYFSRPHPPFIPDEENYA